MNVELFHFLRPYWWLALLPLLMLVALHWRSRADAKAWRKVIDPALMPALLLDPNGKTQRWPMALLALAWFSTVAALAGPTWERLPTPVFQGSGATVFIVNLSDSMNAADVSPSRIGRARFELQDAVQKSAGQQMGLIIFSDEPYVVTPLADDPLVVEDVISILTTDLMPGRGERVDRALKMGLDLLQQAGIRQGQLLLFTDSAGDDSAKSLAAAKEIEESGFSLSVLGFGTSEGAPVPNSNGRGFRVNAQGKPVLDQMVASELKKLASAGGGRFAVTSADDSDLDKLLNDFNEMDANLEESDLMTAGFDAWNDFGAWIVILPLALALMAFRKGWNGNAAMMVLMISPMQVSVSVPMQVQEPKSESVSVPMPVSMPVQESESAQAKEQVPVLNWQNQFFQNQNQIAEQAFALGNYEQAATQFSQPDWKASAMYKAGDFEAATEAFAELDGLEADYNRGNSLARSGKLEEAIAAYDEALEVDPAHEDALFNRELIQKLLDEQEKEEQENQDDQEGEPDEDSEGQEGGDSDEQQESSDSQDSSEEQNNDNPSEEQDQEEENEEDAEQQQAQDPEEESESTEEQPTPEATEEKEVSEKDQATEQWLNKIPVDPGGLLREKLRRRHARKRYRRPR